MSSSYTDIDAMIRAGETRQARLRLQELKIKSIPRQSLSEFANLCRRVGMPNLAVKALFTVVRGNIPGHAAANFVELAEYAVALQRLGANREALEILNAIPAGQSDPELAQLGLYQSFCLVSQWKYNEALHALNQALASARQQKNSYLEKIIQVNRYAAKIAIGQFEGVAEELSALVEVFRTEGLKRLQANGLELLAQTYLLQNDLRSSELCLDEAVRLHQDEKTWDQLYIRKWRGILQAVKQNDPSSLLQLRSEAEANGHFESLREIDYHLLRTGGSTERLDYLFFGTPHQSYRERLKELSVGRELPMEAVVSAPGVQNDLPVLDLMAGSEFLGSLPHRVLHLLLRDFYHPYRVAEIFGHLHPDEFFDPDHSPNRVHQSIFATREFIETQKLNLNIAVTGSRFRLAWQSSYRLHARKAVLPVTQDQIFQWKIELTGSEKSWSRLQVQELLGCSKKTTADFLSRGEQQGFVHKHGLGPSTHYDIDGYTFRRGVGVSE